MSLSNFLCKIRLPGEPYIFDLAYGVVGGVRLSVMLSKVVIGDHDNTPFQSIFLCYKRGSGCLSDTTLHQNLISRASSFTQIGRACATQARV